jgi:hypothetical protein
LISAFVFDIAIGADSSSPHTDRETFCAIDNKTKALYMLFFKSSIHTDQRMIESHWASIIGFLVEEVRHSVSSPRHCGASLSVNNLIMV